MELITIRLLIDFGLVVLIWLVQLVIYPGLCHYGQTDLKTWHASYTHRIAYVVMPLMLAQLAITGYQAFREINAYTVGSALIVGVLWASTFYRFVPLHGKIAHTGDCTYLTKKLVYRNWSRTLLWSLLFIWTLFVFFDQNDITVQV